MRVLVGCEFSGVVREAFRSQGHHAWSCDLLPSDDRSRFHIQCDVMDVIDGWMPVRFMGGEEDDWCEDCNADLSECECIGPTQEGIEYKEINGTMFGRPIESQHWDLMVAHPPCTYLAASGIHWEKKIPGRREKSLESVEFVKRLMNAPINKIAVENPIGRLSTAIRKPDQIVQPWYFGDDASKATCLWLKNLTKLKDTKRLSGDSKTRRANQTKNGQNNLPPSAMRWKIRSTTYRGIAEAMATQWGGG